jgi:hypothetical protein
MFVVINTGGFCKALDPEMKIRFAIRNTVEGLKGEKSATIWGVSFSLLSPNLA